RPRRVTNGDLPSVGDLFDDEEAVRRLNRTMFPHLVAGFNEGVEITAGSLAAADLMTFRRRMQYESKSLGYAAEVFRGIWLARQGKPDAYRAAIEKEAEYFRKTYKRE